MKEPLSLHFRVFTVKLVIVQKFRNFRAMKFGCNRDRDFVGTPTCF